MEVVQEKVGLIQVLGRQKKGELHECETSLIYIVSSRINSKYGKCTMYSHAYYIHSKQPQTELHSEILSREEQEGGGGGRRKERKKETKEEKKRRKDKKDRKVKSESLIMVSLWNLGTPKPGVNLTLSLAGDFFI